MIEHEVIVNVSNTGDLGTTVGELGTDTTLGELGTDIDERAESKGRDLACGSPQCG